MTRGTHKHGRKGLRTNIYGKRQKSADHIKHTVMKAGVNDPLKHSKDRPVWV